MTAGRGQRSGGANASNVGSVRKRASPIAAQNHPTTPPADRRPEPSPPVGSLDRLAPVLAAQLDRLGIVTVRDLVRHYPARYDDLRAPVRISDLSSAPDGDVNVLGLITRISHVRLRGRVRSKSTAAIEDGSGILQAVWFGRPYIMTQLKAGMRVFLRGRVERTLAGPRMSVSQHRVVRDGEAFEGDLEPVYPLTAGLQNRTLRRLIGKALDATLSDPHGVIDPLPASVSKGRGFVDARWALRAIHQPHDMEETERAKRRLIFEEFFLLAIGAALRRAAIKSEPAPDMRLGAAAVLGLHEEFERLLPFSLTRAQRRVVGEIWTDMGGRAPMNRLLQGDVGSGKTAVAAAAILRAARAGYQTAFMAPTEILASQQFGKLDGQLSRAGLRCALLVGGLRRRTRDLVLDELKHKDLDVVVGTHALITDDVVFGHLGLVVIDEQHRFGVMQRAALRAKARGHTPHTLVMTATPIPRTLAQSVYADLDVSIIDELPPGRQPVKTYVRPASAKKKIFEFVREQVSAGRQAFVVCPAIEESERAVHSAEDEAERLRREELAGLRVALVHGRMTSQEKDDVMRLFGDGFVQVLISTTVVEVGVDIPNATVMVVLDAHVFGLAQLHQLRGRVGRGEAKSYCILVAAEGAGDAARLDVLARTNDGFEVAEEDLKLRGSGDLGGIRQHGGDDFKLAHLIRDFPVFVEAKRAAEAVVAADPHLKAAENEGLAAHLDSLDRETTIKATS